MNILARYMYRSALVTAMFNIYINPSVDESIVSVSCYTIVETSAD